MAFFCYICEEESTHICRRCTKDSCDNHLCERCHRCSDCCECEVRLDEQPPHPAEGHQHHVPETEVVFPATAREVIDTVADPDVALEAPPNGLPPEPGV